MSGMNVLNCDCAVDASGDCSCDVTQMHLACGRHSLEVYTVLPETGVVGTTYFVGDNTQGYTEYVWNPESGFVEMGTAAATTISQATVDALGLAKLSTADALTASTAGAIGVNGAGQLLARKATAAAYGVGRLSTSTVLSTAIGSNIDACGGFVGFNANGQLVAMSATLDRFGTVRLGSASHANYSQPYCVSIAASNTDGHHGKLFFNLKREQSDGSPGVLKYVKISDNPLKYEMYVEEAGVAQLGVVKMLHSLNGYTDAEIEAMRETHAASVGLVTDGLESFCEWFFTDSLMQRYFDTWASGKALGEEVWANHREELVANVSDEVIIHDGFVATVEEKTVEWLTATATDAYFEGLFGEKVLAKTKEIVDAHWTDDLNAAIENGVSLEVETQLDPAIRDYMTVADNVKAVAKVVAQTVQVEVNENSAQLTEDYLSGVVNSEVQITAEGEQTTFDAYVAKKANAIVEQQLETINANIAKSFSRAFTSTVLWEGDAAKATVEVSGLADYDKLVVYYSWNYKSFVVFDLNVARIDPDAIYSITAGGATGFQIDTGSRGAADYTPAIRLTYSTGTVEGHLFNWSSNAVISKVVGLNSAQL